jgi:hypothetical protein
MVRRANVLAIYFAMAARAFWGRHSPSWHHVAVHQPISLATLRTGLLARVSLSQQLFNL